MCARSTRTVRHMPHPECPNTPRRRRPAMERRRLRPRSPGDPIGRRRRVGEPLESSRRPPTAPSTYDRRRNEPVCCVVLAKRSGSDRTRSLPPPSRVRRRASSAPSCIWRNMMHAGRMSATCRETNRMPSSSSGSGRKRGTTTIGTTRQSTVDEVDSTRLTGCAGRLICLLTRGKRCPITICPVERRPQNPA